MSMLGRAEKALHRRLAGNGNVILDPGSPLAKKPQPVFTGGDGAKIAPSRRGFMDWAMRLGVGVGLAPLLLPKESDAAPLVVTPFWFGAKGDNATDDSAAFAKLLSTLTDGTIIDLQGQNYRISTSCSFVPHSFTIRNGTITFINVNAGGQFLCTTGTGKVIRFENVAFQGTPCRHTNSGGSNNANVWWDLRLFDRIDVVNCTFTNDGFTTTNMSIAGNFIDLRYNREVSLDHCRFIDIDSDAFFVEGDSAIQTTELVSCTNCYFFNTAGMMNSYSVFNTACCNTVKFTNNYVNNVSDVTNSTAVNLNCKNMICSHNLFDNCAKGVDFDIGSTFTITTQYCDIAVISNNTFLDCVYGIISVSESGDATHAPTLFCGYDVSIIGNVFYSTKASSFAINVLPGRALTIAGNTIYGMTNGVYLDFQDTLPLDPDSGMARAPICGKYSLNIIGNTFDTIGVGAGNYDVPLAMINMNDSAAPNISRFQVSINGNNFLNYPSAITPGVLLIAIVTGDRFILSFTNNKFYQVYSLISVVSSTTFTGGVIVQGNYFDTDQTNAELVSTFGLLLFTPRFVRWLDNYVAFRGANQCMVNNQLATGGITVYEFYENEIELFAGFTDVSSQSPLVHNLNQVANQYTFIAENNKITVVDMAGGPALVVNGIFTLRPKVCVISDNYVKGCGRGILPGNWNSLLLIGNVVENAITFAFACGAAAGTGTVDSGKVSNNITVDTGGILVNGFDLSSFRLGERVFVDNNQCLSASGFKFSYGLLNLSQVSNNRSVIQNGVTRGISGAIASGANIAHGLGVVPTLVFLESPDGVPTAISWTADATNIAVTYVGGGTHAFVWQAERPL